MKNVYVVYQKDGHDGDFTGVVGVFTDINRAYEVRDRSNALSDGGYAYAVESADLDPTDVKVFETA